MKSNDILFLQNVKNYLKENPHLLPKLVEFATEGVLENNKELATLNLELETIALAAVNSRFKNRFDFVKQKILKLQANLSFDWSTFIEGK